MMQTVDEGVSEQPRWQLPHRRRISLTVAIPATFLLFAAAFSVLGDLQSGVGLGLAFAGITWQLGVVAIRFTDTPEPPGPRTLYPSRAERRHMLQIVRRHEILDAEEAAHLRPLVEQTGRTAARGVLTGLAMTVAWAGFATFQISRAWWAIGYVALVVMAITLTLGARRDRHACADFLDRY